jgi:hypothetical protein
MVYSDFHLFEDYSYDSFQLFGSAFLQKLSHDEFLLFDVALGFSQLVEEVIYLADGDYRVFSLETLDDRVHHLREVPDWGPVGLEIWIFIVFKTFAFGCL